jgi:hypothetical protein
MFAYELPRIETAKNPVPSLRQRRDATNVQDGAALRTVYDYESFARLGVKLVARFKGEDRVRA